MALLRSLSLLFLAGCSAEAAQIPVTAGEPISRHEILRSCHPYTEYTVADIRAGHEVTNPQRHVIGVGRQLLAIDYLNGKEIARYGLEPARMENVTPNMHHLIIQASALDVMEGSRADRRCYVLIVWAVYASATASTRLIVEDGYGQMIVSLRRSDEAVSITLSTLPPIPQPSSLT